METCFDYVNRDMGYFSSDERRFITKIRKLKQKFPDQVQILAEPENNGGCIYCSLPSSWLKIIPKREVTDDERELRRVRWNIQHGYGENVASDAGKTGQKPVPDGEDEDLSI